MGQLNLGGTLTAGPSGSGDVFPGMQAIVPLGFREGASKQFGVATGVLTAVVNSPGAFVRLEGVGPAAPVTQGSFLYLRADGLMQIRLTNDDGSGGTSVQVVPVHGLAVIEFPTVQPLELLEIKGSGKVEYLVAGQS